MPLKKFYFLAFVFLAIFFAAANLPSKKIELPSDEPLAANSLSTKVDISSELLGNINSYGNLPIASVETFNATNSWATVVLLPQTHKNPGSQTNDQINDSATIAQNQLYLIVKNLFEKFNIDFAMAEGDLYDKVPQKKIDQLSKKIKYKNELIIETNNLKTELIAGNYDEQTQNQILKPAYQLIDSLEREISLTGAPYKLKAEGVALNLYGIENKSTLDQSSEIVRNYLYQEDRLKQLTTNKNVVASGEKINNSSLIDDLYQYLKNRNTSKLENNLKILKSLADEKGQSHLAEIASSTIMTYQQIKKIKLEESAQINSVPSRQDNPYQNISDPNQIQKMIKASEEKIQTVIIDQRNYETAINFASELKNQNEKFGILQFGAGHKDGLIKELNKQGLTVIVITADEVNQRS